MTTKQRAVGMLANATATETALQQLNRSAFTLDRVYVTARNTDQEDSLVNTQLCRSLRDRFDAQIGKINDSRKNTISLKDALIHLDIPVDIAQQYNDLVESGRFLMMVEGESTDIKEAKEILSHCGIQEWVVYKIVLEHPEVIIVDRRNNSD